MVFLTTVPVDKDDMYLLCYVFISESVTCGSGFVKVLFFREVRRDFCTVLPLGSSVQG